MSKLSERAKELKCIYQVSEALKDEDAELLSVFNRVLEAIPPGYQHPTICETRIILEGEHYSSPDFRETQWMQRAELIIDNHIAGEIHVSYLQDVFEGRQAFLPEEQKLLNVVAAHLSRYIFHRRLRKTLEMMANAELTGASKSDNTLLAYETDEHWKWRFHAAQKIADMIDMERFGIEAIYLIGSVKAGNAGAGSDIDLLLHCRGDKVQEDQLLAWLEGWGLGLAELNFFKTGYAVKSSIIDCHIVHDEDIKKKSSFGVMIGSVSNGAKLLRSRDTV